MHLMLPASKRSLRAPFPCARSSPKRVFIAAKNALRVLFAFRSDWTFTSASAFEIPEEISASTSSTIHCLRKIRVFAFLADWLNFPLHDFRRPSGARDGVETLFVRSASVVATTAEDLFGSDPADSTPGGVRAAALVRGLLDDNVAGFRRRDALTSSPYTIFC